MKLRMQKFQFLIAGIPLSPLHNSISIGQELCLRGHNVTVFSFADRGRKKVEKYSSRCKLGYVNLGPLPVSEEKEEQVVLTGMATNSTRKQITHVMNNLMLPYNDALANAMEAYFKGSPAKFDYALLGLPFGRTGQLLRQHGIDFAVNIPTIVVPPLVPWAAPYVPIPFYHVSVHNMTFLDRVLVIGGNTLIDFFRAYAYSVGFKFTLVPEMDWDLWNGRLVFVNTIPGMDITQPLPPLVQYTGPVVDVKKMEPFSDDVAQWLEEVPEDMPVVYVSFGTVARLTPDRARAMLSTLTSSEYYTLWALPKPQQEGLPGDIPSSVKIHHWVPTARALAHPKVKAFVSHCGGNSATESMALGVPLVGYPQFGDQPAVCQRIADAGAGITGPPGGWVQSADVLHVLNTERYAERAVAMSRLLERFGGVSRAVDLLELAVHGDLKLLETPLERTSSSQFFLRGYDLMIYLNILVFMFACCCMRCCSRRPAPAKEKKEKVQ